MRILHFMADGAAGGGSTVVLGLLEGLRQAGQNPVLLTQAESYCEAAARSRGIQAYGGAFMESRTDPRATIRFEEVVRDSKPDLVHLHGGRAAFFARQHRSTPMVYTVHGYHFLRKPLVTRWLGMIAERQAVTHVREIAFVCRYDQKLAEQRRLLGGHPSRVIYNGVSFGEMPPANPRPRQIAFIHRLVPQKDPLMAVETMALLAQEGYRMVMAGGGDLRSQVDARVQALGLGAAIEIRGEVQRAEALSILAESSVMLMTSRWEGLPLAPLEAMALGTPVVVPSVSGIPEIVTSGHDGFLVPDHSSEAYARAVRTADALADRAALIERAKTTVRERFGWETCLAGYRALYEAHR